MYSLSLTQDCASLVACFECVQSLLDMRVIEAGHDRSDGGLLTTVLEMAIAGCCGIEIDLALPSDPPLSSVSFNPSVVGSSTDTNSTADSAACAGAELGSEAEAEAIKLLFSEELGIVLEVLPQNMARVVMTFAAKGLNCIHIGRVTEEQQVCEGVLMN